MVNGCGPLGLSWVLHMIQSLKLDEDCCILKINDSSKEIGKDEVIMKILERAGWSEEELRDERKRRGMADM